MSEKEVFCASLDNTSIKNDKESIGISNPNQTNDIPKQNTDSQGSKHVEKASTSDENIALDSNSFDKPKLNSSSSKHLSSGESEEKLDDNQEYSEIDYDEDVMTGSYGEISLDRELLNCDKNTDSLSSREDLNCFPDEKGDVLVDEINDQKRPNSLVLTASATTSKDGGPYQVHQSMQTSMVKTDSADPSPSVSSEEFAVHSSRHRTGSDTSGLSELQGTLTVDGDVVTFVAEDLAEKIKMSSPVSRWADASSFGGSQSSTPSLYKQALQPIHIIDPTVITDLEAHAKKVATCVDTMLENLSGTLQSISSLTVDCMETYENSVCKTCDAVDLNIKAVYQLMAKCEELNNSMGPLYCLSSDIKYIKMMLEQLEHIVEHRS
ncbi:hypothetical protein JTE90_023493 [Oedothorax gibbosus]|uniref:BLOC-1-related complex subunit 6 C-terminal helix domain-containing protein n=1 Tax=Oedothorax gibbosus TaxID=931172 RepID=A0AAV6VRN0_9ARAC|nr:hypothetical protein JTE90_023493 [Oedothorax gibbosus]